MPWLLNPYSLLALQWAVRKGLPLVASRLGRVSPIENVLFEGPARLEHGSQSRPGTLWLTPDVLGFASGGSGNPRDALVIPLPAVEEVRSARRRFLGLFGYGTPRLTMRAEHGVFRFLVDVEDQPRWTQMIEAARQADRPD